MTPPTPSLVTEVRWNWDWSPAATALILAAAVFWVALVYANEQRFVSRRQRTLFAVLRLATVVLILVMFAQPTFERRRVARARLVILLDNSASMDTRDESELTRREAWQSLLTSGPQPLLDSLRSRLSVETLTFDTTVTPLSNPQPPAPNSQPPLATHLGDAIDHALRQLPGPRPAAILLMTDGINTAGLSLADAAARARTLGVPLYIVALGSNRPRADVSLDDVLVEEVVFPGDRLQIEAAVRAVGYAGKPARVTLKRIGEDASDLLAETQITLPADGDSQSVRLALRPTDPGPMRVALEVQPQSGEDDVTNNRAELTIDVRDRPIRALLVASTPSFEFRALKSLLERDPAIQLRVRLQDADPEYASVDEAALRDFPATEAELLEYDVVLLGDVDPQLLPRQTWNLLQKFVSKHGGGLVLIAGPRFMPQAFADIPPMRTLLPIDASANRLRLSAPAAPRKIQPTPLGLEDPSLQLGETPAQSTAIWAEFPPVLWSLDAPLPKPGVQTLAIGVPANRSRHSATDPPPMILRNYVGAGEVLMHATDETWRWRWQNDDRYFARYWGQALRRLARGRALRGAASLTTNRTEYDPNTLVTIRLRLSAQTEEVDAPITIELAGDSTPTREINLPRKGTHANLFEQTLRGLVPDHYTARLTTQSDSPTPLTAEFTITAPPTELAQLAVNTASLAAAAATTGGKLYTAKTASRLRDELPAPQPTAVEQLPDEPLWNSPWLLAAVCITLATEWLLRRRAGML